MEEDPGSDRRTGKPGVLTRPVDDNDTQPSVFAYESLHIGRDDVVPRTPPSVAEKAQQDSMQEIEEICTAFAAYMRGEKGPWLVPPERLSGRLDAKFLRPWSVKQLEKHWGATGASSKVLGNIVEPVEEEITLEPDKTYRFPAHHV